MFDDTRVLLEHRVERALEVLDECFARLDRDRPITHSLEREQRVQIPETGRRPGQVEGRRLPQNDHDVQQRLVLRDFAPCEQRRIDVDRGRHLADRGAERPKVGEVTVRVLQPPEALELRKRQRDRR